MNYELSQKIKTVLEEMDDDTVMEGLRALAEGFFDPSDSFAMAASALVGESADRLTLYIDIVKTMELHGVSSREARRVIKARKYFDEKKAEKLRIEMESEFWDGDDAGTGKAGG